MVVFNNLLSKFLTYLTFSTHKSLQATVLMLGLVIRSEDTWIKYSLCSEEALSPIIKRDIRKLQQSENC